MLSRELAEKYYQERIDSESRRPFYTDEELRLQKERKKREKNIEKNYCRSKVNSIQLFQWLGAIFIPKFKEVVRLLTLKIERSEDYV